MSTTTMKDGTQIYYKDTGRGQSVLFSIFVSYADTVAAMIVRAAKQVG